MNIIHSEKIIPNFWSKTFGNWKMYMREFIVNSSQIPFMLNTFEYFGILLTLGDEHFNISLEF